MEMGQIISLRMVGTLFSLLLFVQLPGIFVSGFATQSNDCGAGLIAYLNSYDVELFYINGNLVDKTKFCKALQFHYANHCAFEGFFGSDYCGLDLSLAELPYKAGRKILQKDMEEPKTNGKHPIRPTEDKNDPKSLSTPKKVGIAAAGIFFFLSCAVICPCFYRRRKTTAHTVLSKDLNSMDSVSSFEMNSASEKIPPSPLRVPPSPSRFTMSPKLRRIGSIHLNMSQVIKATHNFSPSLQIGEGGFGTVFKAKLEDGQVVAIKRAKKEQFDSLRTEFSSEVELLAKIDHRNLVKLLGFIDKGNERLIITEFVPNGTLREHLDGQHGKILDFNQRLEIAIDVAHGLTYLHLYSGEKCSS
ncbi:hypothetical protein Pint_13805 [Pistacia integerrima]|uniref:Uncharacterized protein n=1 Tax=Pistacia integerrima TaxID=434235 RepID=A0ACC0Y673_9ROSI|nr:hypothetical protein Pint_13805 [Pistacia integerrima]